MNASSTQTNLMTNATFENGLSPWSTDDISGVTYSASTKNVAFNKTNGTAHLFSPQLSVTPGKNYYLENNLSITSNSGGGVGFYIDEYDASGAWVSGQYKVYTSAVQTGDITFTYAPSSTNVASASLQIIFDGGNGLKGTFDNSRLWAL